MALDFPSGPEIGAIYTGTNGIIYVYDGIKWEGQVATVIPNELNTGYIRYYHDSIEGLIDGGDINLTTVGTGTVRAPSLTLPVGSLVEEIASIEVIIEDLTLDTVVDYSTGTGDTLVIGTIGNTTGYAHPWAIYRLSLIHI